MKTWQSYLYTELLKTFLWVLSAVFGLFVLLDYSIHMRELCRGIYLSDVTYYYICHLSKYFAVLMPLTLLISTIKVLISLNANRELVALQAGGIGLKKIARPFIVSGLLVSALLYANFEWWMPISMSAIEYFEEMQFSKDSQEQPELSVVPLEDGSKLYYQRFFPREMALFDVLWVRSADEVLRIKSLKLSELGPEGFCVDRLQRSKNHRMELVASHDYTPLPELKIDTLASRPMFIPFIARSISELIGLQGSTVPFYAQKQTAIESQWLYKLAFPLTCLIVVWAAFPACVRYSRRLKPTLIYAIALFGFIGLYTIMGAALIMGEASTLPPTVAILTPMGIGLAIFGGRFACI